MLVLTMREPRRQEVTCKLLLLLAQIMAVPSLIGAPFGYAVASLLPLRTVASDTKGLRLAKRKGIEALRLFTLILLYFPSLKKYF